MLRVNGGPANSGTVVKRERGGTWFHVCEVGPKRGKPLSTMKRRTLPGYWVSCPDCGAKRP